MLFRQTLLFCAVVLSGAFLSPAPAAAQAAFDVVTSPEPLPAVDGRPRLFLGGSIAGGDAPDWQADLIEAVDDLDVVVLNPRRADWNSAWRPEADEPEFRRQVEWELAALEAADVIVMYFAPGTQSPISLLELGLHARSGKMIVLAPDGFWRKGNVDITAETYGVRQVDDMETLIVEARRALQAVAARVSEPSSDGPASELR